MPQHPARASACDLPFLAGYTRLTRAIGYRHIKHSSWCTMMLGESKLVVGLKVPDSVELREIIPALL